MLRGVSQAFHDKPQEVETNRAGLLQALHKKAANKAIEIRGEGPLLPFDLLDRIAVRLAEECDPVWGGLGQAPKFPSPYLFENIWRAWLRDRTKARLFEAVTVTLDRMCQGGIYDHLGGGFARYATDAEWLIPHFEKMLYDNAQLIDLLTLVWQETKSPLYAVRIAETCDWVLREMVAEMAAASPRPTMPTARASRASSMSGTRPRSTRSWDPTMRPSSSRPTTSRPRATGSTTPSCIATAGHSSWATPRSNGWRCCAPG